MCIALHCIAALEGETERAEKCFITAENFSVQAQAQERLERSDTNSRKKERKNPASKMKQISKKIGKLQEEIKAVEEELEAKAGHPLSKADKVKDETLGNLMGKVKKLKKEKQELKEKDRDSLPKPVEGIKDIPEHSSVEHAWSLRSSISEEFEEEADEKVEEEKEEGDWHIMTKEELR